MKILIIEDESSIRETMQTMLQLNGYDVMAAADGLEGVRLAESGPDFIFCDVSMPGLDGFGVIEAVRQREASRLVPFVFLTAKADRADQRRGMALGADDYITKPFAEKEIIDAITARTRRHRPLQERVDELVEQRRRQMGADWSHELLTPLNGMLGGLQLLDTEIESLSRVELKQMIELIRGGVERQEKLARKLIRYFELESLKDAPHPTGSFCCRADHAALEGTMRAMMGTWREKDVETSCSPGLAALPELYLVDAVAELVGNGLRFSAPGDKVTVQGLAEGNRYRITVIDRGSGMSAAERAAVAPFTQFDRAKHGQQGLGLGLAVVRQVASLAKGKMTLAEGPGAKGLCVTLDLASG